MKDHIHLRLIKEIKRHIPSNESVNAHLKSILNLHPRSVYNKINGVTPFTLDEIEEIAKSLPISLDSVISVQDNMEEDQSAANVVSGILQSWLRVVQQLEDKEKPQILMVTNSLPFALVFRFPELVKFKLFQLIQFSRVSQGATIQNFDPDSELYAEVESYCEQIKDIYQDIPTTEIWGFGTFLILFNQLDQLFEQSRVAAKDYLMLMNNLKDMLDLCHAFALHGYKSTEKVYDVDSRYPSYKLYINHTQVVDEYTILSARNVENQIFHGTTGFVLHQSKKKMVMWYTLQLMQTGHLMSGQYQKIVQKTFDAIYSKIEEVKRMIESR